MAQFKPIRIESNKLDTLPISDGQYIVTTDTGKTYMDNNNDRIELAKTEIYPKFTYYDEQNNSLPSSAIDSFSSTTSPTIELFIEEYENFTKIKLNISITDTNPNLPMISCNIHIPELQKYNPYEWKIPRFTPRIPVQYTRRIHKDNSSYGESIDKIEYCPSLMYSSYAELGKQWQISCSFYLSKIFPSLEAGESIQYHSVSCSADYIIYKK